MAFFSLTFLLFFLIFALAYHLAKSPRQQWAVMLAGNLVFYIWWDLRFALLLEGLIVLCWLLVRLYGRSGRRFFLHIAVIACLGALFLFKYLNFFLDSFCTAFGIEGQHTLKLLLPLGISFYLLQLISYVLDAGRGSVSPDTSLLKVSAYVSFFPQITSGPIVKAHDFLPQLDQVHRIRKANVQKGAQRFLLGVTKKFLLADRMGVAVNAVYAAPEAYHGFSIFMAMISFSLQLYFDFSGYSDMAIGLAEILDLDLGKNFDLPFLSRNPSEFWNRWHISLSTWFRDYVYIPLGGSRCSDPRIWMNLFLTMLLSGLWHGANWTFLVWGAFNGLALVLHREFRRRRTGPLKPSRFPAVSILLSNLFFTLMLVIFRSPSIHEAFHMVGCLFHSSGILYVSIYELVFLALACLIHILAYRKDQGHNLGPCLDLNRFSGKFIFSVWIFLVILLRYQGETAFIYAQF